MKSFDTSFRSTACLNEIKSLYRGNMQLPAAIPKSLEFTSQIADEESLFKTLVKEPPNLIKFLVRACADELWAIDHKEFMSKSLNWVTEQFFQDRLLMSFAQKLGKVIRAHFGEMNQFLPKNLTFKLKDNDVEVNSLLYGSRSEYLREMIRRECRDRHKTVLIFKDLPYRIFSILDSFITKETYEDLIRLEKKEIYKTLRWSMQWQLDELTLACQEALKPYITPDNVFAILLTSHLKDRLRLRQLCYDFVNELKKGYRFDDRGPETLALEFLEFNEDSLAAFEKVKKYITHVITAGSVPEDRYFPLVIKQCPKLKCIDLSRTNQFFDNYKELPENLQELELSACLWLTNADLDTLIDQCPQLSRLVIQSDVRLDFEAWGALKKLTGLKILDLTRCSQVGDPDLGIILQGCPNLIVLTLEECRGLTDSGFTEMTEYNTKFTHLNLARTWISDQPLIELGSKCEDLIALDITHCENITSVGIVETARNAKNLREFHIAHCNVSKEALTEIQKMRPYLKIFTKF